MTFLSAGMLAGLALVALPVVLHLLNRGRTQTVQWGAMEFLMRSIALRSKRIRFEEAMLLALRCLLLVLLALAMARPFLPARGNMPMVLLLAAFAIAAVCVGIAGAMWEHRRARRWLIGVAAVLVALGVGGAVMERWYQVGWWGFDGSPRDLAIIVDGSTAMALPYADDRTYFHQAMAEAKGLAEGLRAGDTVVVFIGAAAPVPLLARPTSDRREIAAVFAAASRTPPGGRFAGAETLNAAVTALATGRNPQKTVIIIGAGHRGGLAPDQSAQWEFINGRMDALLPMRPDLLYRRLRPERPRDVRNLALSPPTMSRRLADTARPIRIETDMINTGSTAASPGRIELLINDEKIDERVMAAEIPPGVTETITFTHQFAHAGPHTVLVRVTASDDIEADNSGVRVVHVEDQLPVLIVDGAPTSRRLKSASAFLNIALNPAEDQREGLMQRIWAATLGRGGESKAQPQPQHGNFVKTEVRPITEIGSITDLRQYRVVVLANVPRLPDAFSARLAEAVRNGLGLWIVPGHLTQPEQFDRWRSPAGEPLWPAAPIERVSLGRKPMPAQLQSFTHPTQRVFALDRHSDAEALRIQTYWRLLPDPNDPNVRTAGSLLNGDHFMAERTFGKGSIILSSFMLDRQDSNLPSLKSFVPLVHETLYHLASSDIPDDNTRSGSEFSTTVILAPATDKSPAPAAQAPVEAKVTTPSGREASARITPVSGGFSLITSDTIEPGLYGVALPESWAGLAAKNRLNGGTLRFAVLSDPLGAVIDPMTESDERRLNEHIKFFLADSPDDLAMVLAEEVPGSALWTWFMLAAMAVLLGELAVARFITMSRRTDTTAPLAFDAGSSDASAFKDRIQKWFPNRQT